MSLIRLDWDGFTPKRVSHDIELKVKFKWNWIKKIYISWQQQTSKAAREQQRQLQLQIATEMFEVFRFNEKLLKLKSY